MQEAYFKLKLIEEIIGYIITGLALLPFLLLIIYSTYLNFKRKKDK